MTVHPHAIEQFRNRTGCQRDDEYIKNKLLEIANTAQPAKFKHPKYAVMALLNHSFETAEYFMSSGWLLVVVKDEIRTIHHNEAKRWTAQ